MTRLPPSFALCLLLLLAACTQPPVAEVMHADAGAPTPEEEASPGPERDGGTRTPEPGCSEGCEIVDVVAGLTHSCALRASGEVLCWGGNEQGQLGDGRMRHGDCANLGEMEDQDCAALPTSVSSSGPALGITARGGLSTCAFSSDGDVWCWGLESVAPRGREQLHRRSLPEGVPGFAGAVDLSDGFDHTCAVLDDGRVLCLGQNGSGQLGTGDTVERATPGAVSEIADAIDVEVSVMSDFSCARTAAGTLCWGSNETGQLGDGRHDHGECAGELSSWDCSLTPVAVPALHDAEEISLGHWHGCALMPEGRVRCWGGNAAGQLGLGDVDFRDEPAIVLGVTAAVQVSAGAAHTCALLEDGHVRCWGANNEGQLGDGSLDHGSRCRLGSEVLDCAVSPVEVANLDDAVRIAAGLKHTCALRAGGDVVCWGWSAHRQLGDGDRHRNETPVRVEGLDL